MATLRNAEQDSALAKSHSDSFRAAVAFYPNCGGISGIMAVPTLVLTGELDDWTPAKECQAMAEGRSDIGMRRETADRSMISLVVYPGVYHYFNAPIMRSLTQVKGVRFMGHWLEYNADADKDSIERVREFEQRGAPVDAYGIGSALLRGSNDFTADIVMVDGRPCAKVGRRLRPNPRLERVH